MRRSVCKGILGIVMAGALLTGCSSVRFIANGREFKQICEENGLQVQDASSVMAGNQAYKSLTDAYQATSEDGSYSVWYIRFSDASEAKNYYASVVGQMDGTEYTGSNYQAEIETVKDKSREIYMESGRIIYAEGDTDAINSLENQLIGTWSSRQRQSDTGSSSSSGSEDAAAETPDSSEAGAS